MDDHADFRTDCIGIGEPDDRRKDFIVFGIAGRRRVGEHDKPDGVGVERPAPHPEHRHRNRVGLRPRGIDFEIESSVAEPVQVRIKIGPVVLEASAHRCRDGDERGEQQTGGPSAQAEKRSCHGTERGAASVPPGSSPTGGVSYFHRTFTDLVCPDPYPAAGAGSGIKVNGNFSFSARRCEFLRFSRPQERFTEHTRKNMNSSRKKSPAKSPNIALHINLFRCGFFAPVRMNEILRVSPVMFS